MYQLPQKEDGNMHEWVENTIEIVQAIPFCQYRQESILENSNPLWNFETHTYQPVLAREQDLVLVK